jgi:lipopolysaccharide cholinephosphotransferase
VGDKTLYLDQLKKIHKIQLEMALEVKKICDKYNIKYFIIAGTLLGAVRHKGFIPWDDDLDIGMLREDYDKFIQCAEKELSSEYFLQTWDTDSGFGLPIAKVRKNGTKFVEINSAKTSGHNGIYIDIFPFDNVPTSKIAQKIHDISTYILKRIILCQVGYELWLDGSKFKKAVYKVVNSIAKITSLDKNKKLLEKQMKKYNSDKTEYAVAFGGAYGYSRERIRREWVENLTPIKFEDEEFMCPKNYNAYLTHFYGDYMKPPPENKRYNRHGIIEIDFGSDEE